MILGTNTAIGTGTLALVSGNLQTGLTTGLLLTNPLTFSNSNVTLGRTNPVLFSGNAVLNGTNNTLTVTNAGVTFDSNGVISGAGMLTKAGAGTLVLSAAKPTAA